ncbi:hypothetical protein PGSY75_0622000 [Plasmodium gaboni]|uniref:Uncharacterized protein n=1 Tax=Plasmodium gaboni TaxID=647221 RepID=A0A151LRW6_9APIC|nr:hypothetical protein PGSY75_0622000 [Plasmodium gaboni]KYO01912.1 hypothetical protein PGSY75_0622000 [Plasmodium gaboni]SOV12385.1 conserved Plasmodium protein, unknown function [Plasmodium gaboni]SOV21724.1 conserved Plasmodium protein, unknown function [Plasmodium sp. DRC-Itaito]
MNNVSLVLLSIYFFSYIFVRGYQVIYVDTIDDIPTNELIEEDLSCSWRYYCSDFFHVCERGCSSKKRLKKGYNLINTSTLKGICYFNVECDNYDIYFDTDNSLYFIYFSKLFFHISSDFTLYMNLLKKSDKRSKDDNYMNKENIEKNCNNTNNLHTYEQYKKKSFYEKISYYKKFIAKKFKKNLIKLLIFFLIIYMIFISLFIYTYMRLKNI